MEEQNFPIIFLKEVIKSLFCQFQVSLLLPHLKNKRYFCFFLNFPTPSSSSTPHPGLLLLQGLLQPVFLSHLDFQSILE